MDCHHLDYAGAVKVDCRHLDYAGGEVDCDFPCTASFIQLPASMVFWAPTMSMSKTEERVYLFSTNVRQWTDENAARWCVFNVLND